MYTYLGLYIYGLLMHVGNCINIGYIEYQSIGIENQSIGAPLWRACRLYMYMEVACRCHRQTTAAEHHDVTSSEQAASCNHLCASSMHVCCTAARPHVAY